MILQLEHQKRKRNQSHITGKFLQGRFQNFLPWWYSCHLDILFYADGQKCWYEDNGLCEGLGPIAWTIETPGS